MHAQLRAKPYYARLAARCHTNFRHRADVVSAARPRAATRFRRMRAQPRHRPDADGRADGQRHERIAPAQRGHQVRHQVDRDERQREAERGLQVSIVPTRAGRHSSRDRRRELRRIRDDGDAPDDARRDEPAAGRRRTGSPIVAAQRAADRHRGDRQRRAARAIGEEPGADASRSRPPRSSRTPRAWRRAAPRRARGVSAKLACRKTPIHAHIA